MASRTVGIGCCVAALTAFAVAGCESPTAEMGPSLAIGTTVVTAMQGTGGIGDGAPTFYGQNRQWFDLDVGVSTGVVYGRMEYVDSGFVKEDGNYPHFVVGPEWPGTAVATFVQTSATCVEFEGMGWLINTGEYLAFRVETCDNGEPGAGLDTFAITVPQRLLTHGNVYRAGPLPLVYGELTAYGTAMAPGIP